MFLNVKKINSIKNINDKIINIFEFYNNIYLNNDEIQNLTISKINKKNSKDIKACESKNQNNIDILNNSKKQKLNEMTIIYNIDKNQDKLYIFDINFVNNNKKKCYILIEGEKKELCNYLKLNQRQKENRTITIKLIETETITNMSYMSSSSMISLPDISEWNTEKVIDINSMFYDSSLLEFLPDISKWNTKNVTNMKYLFSGCISLMSLPYISKWDTSNVTDMSYMFQNCNSLIKLPDISKWDTNNVTKMSSMFENCSSLLSLPDISKWNTINVCDMSYMFQNCSSLISLPDISKWKINKKLQKIFMFEGCDEKLIPKMFK